MPRIRLDQLLVARGLAESRARAQALLMAGSVRVDGQVQTKPGTPVADNCLVEIDNPLPYVSRGGFKLAHAFDVFALSPADLVALDVGASTGGFTDVLLQRGARLVYAIDVGYGILDWRLRQDSRVVVVERTNIRHMKTLPAHESNDTEETRAVECVTIDVSFISLRLVLPAVRDLMRPDGWIVALVKPQFEAGPHDVGKGGVVRDAAVHARVLHNVCDMAVSYGLYPHGLTRSPITGPAGNREFLLWLSHDGSSIDSNEAIREVVR